MSNLEWYELAVGIRRRTGIIFIYRRTGIITRQIDYFAGVELDASEADHIDKIDWSLEDLPDDCRSAIDELLERMPEMNPGRDLEIFKAARDIGWIEAMSKRSEWGKLRYLIDIQPKGSPAKAAKNKVRDCGIWEIYLRLSGEKDVFDEQEEDVEIIYSELAKLGKPFSDKSVQEKFAKQFGFEVPRLMQIIREFKKSAQSGQLSPVDKS